MPTQEQLTQALVNADKAGDTNAARLLAQQLKLTRKKVDPDAFDASMQGDITRSGIEGLKRSLPGSVVRAMIREGKDALHVPQSEEKPYESTTTAGRATREVMSVAPDLALPVGGEFKLAKEAPKLLRALSTVGQTSAKSGGMAGVEDIARQFADKGNVDLSETGEAAKRGAEFGAGARTATGALMLPRTMAKEAQKVSDPKYAEYVKRLKDEGFPLRPAQEAGTKHSQDMENLFTFFGGKKTQDAIVKEQQKVGNRLVNAEMGISSDVANHDAVVTRKEKLGRDLGGIYDRGWVAPSAGKTGPQAIPPLHLPDELNRDVQRAYGHGISGKEYVVLRGRLRDYAEQHAGTPDSRWYWEARRDIDRSFLPATEAALPKLRYQYGNAKKVLELKDAGGFVRNNYDLGKLGEVSKSPGWHERSEAQQPYYVWLGEAADATGLQPLRSGEVTKVGKREDVGSPHAYGALHSAASALGLPGIGLAAGALVGNPVAGVALGTAARPAVRAAWYGAPKAPEWLSRYLRYTGIPQTANKLRLTPDRIAARIPVAIPAQEASDETQTPP